MVEPPGRAQCDQMSKVNIPHKMGHSSWSNAPGGAQASCLWVPPHSARPELSHGKHRTNPGGRWSYRRQGLSGAWDRGKDGRTVPEKRRLMRCGYNMQYCFPARILNQRENRHCWNSWVGMWFARWVLSCQYWPPKGEGYTMIMKEERSLLGAVVVGVMRHHVTKMCVLCP